MENVSWVVVADASRARVFSTSTNGSIKHINELQLVQELNHHDSHKKNHDIVSDKAGSRSFGTFVQESDPKENEAANFAHNIGIYLEKNRNDHHFTHVILVAPPHFLGLLKQHVSKGVEKLITKTLAKDYTSEDVSVITKHLNDLI